MSDLEINISVIVPVYNTPKKYLRACIESIYKQRENGLEFIIINDGSTKQWIDSFLLEAEKKDSRIKYVTKDNTGVGDTRNLGVTLANGKYIMFLDSDDMLLDDACSIALGTIKQNDADVVIFGYDNQKNISLKKYESKILTVNEKKDLILKIISGNTKSFCKKGINIDSPWGKIFKKKNIVVNKIFFPSELQRSQDTIFCLYYYESISTIMVSNKCIYRYTENPMSVCHRFSDISVRMLQPILKELYQYVEKYHRNDRMYQIACAKRGLNILSEAETLYFVNRENEKSFKEVLCEYIDLVSQPLLIESFRVLRISDFLEEKEFMQLMHYMVIKYKLYLPWLLIKKYAKMMHYKLRRKKS